MDLKFTEVECRLLCLQALSVQLKWTEVECGLLCLHALSLEVEVYRSGEWTVVLTGI